MVNISVVVPVYNAEVTLRRCVDSVLVQHFSHFELILVDDGSLDESGLICDECEAKDKRIRVVHQANGGVTAARAQGLTMSVGEYVTFLDADDALPPDALSAFYKATENGLYDIVVGLYDKMADFSESSLTACEYRRCCISGKKVNPAPWAKLFRRNLFNEATFAIPREIIKGEDMLMNIRLSFQNVNPVRLINKVVYHYEVLSSGCMSNFTESQDYEALYHQYRLASIPKEQQTNFTQELIETRLSGLKNIALQNPEEAVRLTDYKQQLVKDISLLNMHLSYLDKLVLYSSSALHLKLYFLFTRIKNKLCRLFRL